MSVPEKALIAMSGGVDSSVAALLMQQQGYDCTGVTMKLFANEDAGIPREQTCCSLDDIEDARRVAWRLGIPYHVFNFADRFKETVMDRFANAYLQGATPNPCIDCNRYLKFEKLMQRADELDIPLVVTGHYARVTFDQTAGRWLLKKGLDETKDQSYVLYSLTQAQLARVRFPLGELTKAQVRRIAEENGFANARKKDSQDICFVSGQSYGQWIEQYIGRTLPAGDFVDLQGNVLGRHKGIIHYTVGQRKGLGLSFDSPRFVCAIDPAANTVTLGKNEDLFAADLVAEDFNWIVAPPTAPLAVTARVRYRQAEQPATATCLPGGRVLVRFAAPQRAVTKGQAVVLYMGDVVAGGGTITEILRKEETL